MALLLGKILTVMITKEKEEADSPKLIQDGETEKFFHKQEEISWH